MLMGRRKTKDLDLPPRMSRKGKAFYYVPSVKPRKWVSLGADKPKALLKWAELEGKGSGRTIADALDRYLAFHLEGLAESTQINYRQAGRAIRKYFGSAPVNEVLPQHIAEYLDTGKSKLAKNLHIGLLSVLYEKMRRWGWTDKNPTFGIRRNPVRRRVRYLTDKEFLTLREAARPLVRVVMDLCYLTGSRQSDILKIRLADFDDSGLRITQKKTKAKQVYTMTAELKTALESTKTLRRKVGSLYLLCNGRGAPYVQRAFQKLWTADFAKTDVEDVVFHDIRGKAATDAKRLGLDYQAILGHTSRDMSDSYIRAIEGTTVSPLRRIVEE